MSYFIFQDDGEVLDMYKVRRAPLNIEHDFIWSFLWARSFCMAPSNSIISICDTIQCAYMYDENVAPRSNSILLIVMLWHPLTLVSYRDLLCCSSHFVKRSTRHFCMLHRLCRQHKVFYYVYFAVLVNILLWCVQYVTCKLFCCTFSSLFKLTQAF